MAGSMARHPWRITLPLLLLAVAITLLLLLQATCFNAAPPEDTTSETGGEISLESGGPPVPSASPASPATPGATGTAAAATAAATPASLVPTVAAAASLPPATPPAPLPPLTGSLKGMVTDETALPLAGIRVYLADAGGRLLGDYRTTGADGGFSFDGLAPATYKLYFSDPGGNYESGWYGPPGSPAGTPIAVTAGGEITVSQVMAAAGDPGRGAVSGRVVAACKDAPRCVQGVAGVLVSAFRVEHKQGYGMTLAGTSLTDSNGYYRVGGLLAGDYLVSFDPPGGSYAYQWYRGQQTFTTAEVIPVHAGETVGKVDAVLEEGGTISGSVTAGMGPVAGAQVDVFDKAGVVVDTVFTGSDGSYRSGRLPAGAYRVRVVAPPPIGETRWYVNGDDFSSADAVVVREGEDTAGIDITLGATVIKLDPPSLPGEEAGPPSAPAATVTSPAGGENGPGDADGQGGSGDEAPPETSAPPAGVLENQGAAGEHQEDLVVYGGNNEATAAQVD